MPGERSGERCGKKKRERRGECTYLGDGLNAARHGEDAVMHARDDFADAGLDASLLPEVSHIFSSLSNDDAGVFCANEGTEGEGVVGGGGGRARPRGRL